MRSRLAAFETPPVAPVSPQALRDSEARYRMLFSSLEEGFLLAEAIRDATGQIVDFRYLEANPACERITGIRREQVVGRTAREVIPAPVDDLIRLYAQVVTSGQSLRHEIYESFLDQYHENYVFRPGPGLVAVLFWDISDRKRTEAALRESEERFRAAFEQAAVGIEMLSLDGRYQRGNQVLSRILGYREEELRQRTFTDITHPDDRERERPLLHDLLAGRIRSYSIEKRYLRKDGESVWVRVTSSLARTSEPYRVSIIEDIGARRRAEQALQESERRWATTLASIGDAVIATDTAGRITFLNATAEALTGWRLPEALQQPVQAVFHILNEHTRQAVEDPVSKVLATGLIVGLANHTLLVRKDGTEVPIDDSGAPIRDEAGRPRGWCSCFATSPRARRRRRHSRGSTPAGTAGG